MLRYLLSRLNLPFISNADVEAKELHLSFDKISSGIRILHLTDFHFHRKGRLEKKVKNIVRSLTFDIALFTGDYVDNLHHIDSFTEYIKSLNFSCPALAVPGNHDYRRNLSLIRRSLEEAGITCMYNQHRSFKLRGNDLNIIGVGCPRMGQDDFIQAVKHADLSDSLNIVISHTSDILQEIQLSPVKEEIDLVLAGDTHGGQIDLPVVRQICDLIYRLEYTRGLFRVNDQILYVNRGLGTSLLPLRINCRPEVAILELVPG